MHTRRQSAASGQLKINYDAKQVKDDIPDHTYVYRVPID